MPSELRILRFRLHEAEHEFLKVNGEENTVCVSNGQLAASLIYYCRKCGIDLPDEGAKEIYVSPEFVEFRIVLRHCASNGAGKAGVQTTTRETASPLSQQSS